MRARLMWWSPLGTTRWWVPRVFRGCDEWCNPSLGVVVPPLGTFIVFYGRRFSRYGPSHDEVLRPETCELCSELAADIAQAEAATRKGEG